ncbi:hemin receptor [Vibrio rumoiensis 1S-45]|uniref:Hemin receptor n=2 Tax=Vibrio rumoiensis TaxID=76258 RepID=A0A1E5E4E9_9VIBR|nr:hemin receptor [Vibrio rumoiensis 1S-45]
MRARTVSFIASISIGLMTPSLVNAQERIISAGAAVTETIEALGASKNLIAIDVTSIQPSDSPLPVIGYHRQLSAEGLIALKPTMIIGSDEMGPDTTLDLLKQSNIKVTVVNSEPSVDGLKQRIDEIAQLTNSESQAQKLKSLVNSQVESLQKHSRTEKKKILFLLIHSGRPANVAGSGTTPDAIINLAGGINPAAEQLNSYKPISVESMLQMQPDVILVSGRSFKEMGGAAGVIKKMPMLASTPAGKSQSIITIDGHALVGGLGLKSLSEAQRIQTLIYP